MKLWLLESRDDSPINIWGYDTHAGFVIRAKTEKDAREIAHGRSYWNENMDHPNEAPWLDPDYTTCNELKQSGEPGVILSDFRAG